MSFTLGDILHTKNTESKKIQKKTAKTFETY